MSSTSPSEAGGLFLWWLSPNVKQDLQRAEERDVAERLERLEIAESEREMAQSFTKPSKVSKAKYNQWLVSEEKRMQGEDCRVEAHGHKQRSIASATSFANIVHERTQLSHAEREAAAERVRQRQEGIVSLGQAGRVASQEIRAKSGELKAEWRSMGSQNRQAHGVEQRKRVQESLEQQRESNHALAYEYKQRVADQAADQARRDDAALAEKRERVARIRAETDAQCVRSARSTTTPRGNGRRTRCART